MTAKFQNWPRIMMSRSMITVAASLCLLNAALLVDAAQSSTIDRHESAEPDTAAASAPATAVSMAEKLADDCANAGDEASAVADCEAARGPWDWTCVHSGLKNPEEACGTRFFDPTSMKTVKCKDWCGEAVDNTAHGAPPPGTQHCSGRGGCECECGKGRRTAGQSRCCRKGIVGVDADSRSVRVDQVKKATDAIGITSCGDLSVNDEMVRIHTPIDRGFRLEGGECDR